MNTLNKGIAPIIAILIIVGIALVGVGGSYYYYKTNVEKNGQGLNIYNQSQNNYSHPTNQTKFEGQVSNVMVGGFGTPNSFVLTVATGNAEKTYTVAANSSTKVINAKSVVTALSSIRNGDSVRVYGTLSGTAITASEIDQVVIVNNPASSGEKCTSNSQCSGLMDCLVVNKCSSNGLVGGSPQRPGTCQIPVECTGGPNYQSIPTQQCTSDSQCSGGMQCYVTNTGNSAGIRGTPTNPGTCQYPAP